MLYKSNNDELNPRPQNDLQFANLRNESVFLRHLIPTSYSSANVMSKRCTTTARISASARFFTAQLASTR